MAADLVRAYRKSHRKRKAKHAGHSVCWRQKRRCDNDAHNSENDFAAMSKSAMLTRPWIIETVMCDALRRYLPKQLWHGRRNPPNHASYPGAIAMAASAADAAFLAKRRYRLML